MLDTWWKKIRNKNLTIWCIYSAVSTAVCYLWYCNYFTEWLKLHQLLWHWLMNITPHMCNLSIKYYLVIKMNWLLIYCSMKSDVWEILPAHTAWLCLCTNETIAICSQRAVSRYSSSLHLIDSWYMYSKYIAKLVLHVLIHEVTKWLLKYNVFFVIT